MSAAIPICRVSQSSSASEFMASVIFMRGVNVGGHKKFQPAALAKDLAVFNVVNIGAAGTFVVRKNVSQTTLRSELRRRLSFDADLMICSAREILDLAATELFPNEAADGEVRRSVSILAKRPRITAKLPIMKPPSDD